MILFDKFKKKQKPDMLVPDSKDYLSPIIENYEDTGKIDLKQVKEKQVIAFIKKNKSLEEQNKYLSKYLQQMVSENETLQN